MEVKAGYKKTDLGVIPRDWDVVPMGQVSKCLVGLTYSPRDVREFGTLVLRASNIQNGKLAFDDNVFVDMDIPARAITQENDILICVRNGSRQLIGKCALIDARTAGSAFGAFMSVLRSDSAKFLFFQFQSSTQKRQIDEVMGATINQITNKDMAAFNVFWPSTKTEQETIAEALSDADALIESLEQLLAKKRQLKQGAMQELLTGKKRLPGFSGKWGVKRLGEVATLYQPVTISAKQFVESGFPVYGANGIVGYYDKANHDTWQVTVTCRGSTCGTVNRTVDRCWITGNAMVLNCDHNESVSKEFFFHLLSNQDLSACITGTGQPQIVRAPLAAFEVFLPSTVAEQAAIAVILSDMDAEIVALEARLAKARLLKQGMMQELLTGRIRLIN